MSSLDHETPSLRQTKPESVPRREGDLADVPANENASAGIETWPDGDPHVFARTLARVLVRHALQEAGGISADELNNPFAVAG